MRSNIQNIRAKLQSNEEIEHCARLCGVIGDETKLKICYLLRHYPNLNVSTIAELVGTSISNASHSLNKLRAAELVEGQRCGQTICYSLKPAAFADILNVIGG